MNKKTKYVRRENYLSFLRNSMNKPIIKVISGVRRSGKSTLLRLFQDELINSGIDAKRIIAINFEDYSYHALTDGGTLHQYILDHLVKDEMNYIFFDEIQHVKNFERIVDSLFLREQVDLYITGSNAYFLSGELATLLTGRYIELKILPLSFAEYARWYRNQGYRLDEDSLFNRYLKSAYPYTLFIEDDRERFDYLQGIYSTIVLLDIVKRLSIKDVGLLERMVMTLLSSIGSPISINKIVNTLRSKGTKLSNTTAERYIRGISDSFIVYPVKRYDIKGRELLDTQRKYYVVDLGLRELILRDHAEDFGHIIENVVFLELMRRYPHVYVGKAGSYEVDFVAIDASGNICYYQVALTTLDESVLRRELRPFNSIKDHYPKYLLTLDQYNQEANYDGVQKINLIRWLLND